jgi:hypothetical protein
LNMSATNITSKCRIASIGPDDVMILRHDANPGRMKFSERTGVCASVIYFSRRPPKKDCSGLGGIGRCA